jgi:hypothetical protein
VFGLPFLGRKKKKNGSGKRSRARRYARKGARVAVIVGVPVATHYAKRHAAAYIVRKAAGGAYSKQKKRGGYRGRYQRYAPGDKVYDLPKSQYKVE